MTLNRSEICINLGTVKNLKLSRSSGSSFERARARIDRFFIENSKCAKSLVAVGIAMEVFPKAYLGAKLGVGTAGFLLNTLAANSERMKAKELEVVTCEGTTVATVAGFAAGLGSAGVASRMTDASTDALASIGGAVALLVGLAVGARFVCSRWQPANGASESRSFSQPCSPFKARERCFSSQRRRN